MKNPSMVSLALLALIIFPAGFRALVRETGETTNDCGSFGGQGLISPSRHAECFGYCGWYC